MSLRDKIDGENNRRNQEIFENTEKTDKNIETIIYNQKVLLNNQIELKEMIENQNKKTNN